MPRWRSQKVSRKIEAFLRYGENSSSVFFYTTRMLGRLYPHEAAYAPKLIGLNGSLARGLAMQTPIVIWSTITMTYSALT